MFWMSRICSSFRRRSLRTIADTDCRSGSISSTGASVRTPSAPPAQPAASATTTVIARLRQNALTCRPRAAPKAQTSCRRTARPSRCGAAWSWLRCPRIGQPPGPAAAPRRSPRVAPATSCPQTRRVWASILDEHRRFQPVQVVVPRQRLELPQHFVNVVGHPVHCSKKHTFPTIIRSKGRLSLNRAAAPPMRGTGRSSVS